MTKLIFVAYEKRIFVEVKEVFMVFAACISCTRIQIQHNIQKQDFHSISYQY
jgi:hypothetical protein